MPTDNLSLSIILGSDVVNPEVINDNFKILDKLGVDYIVSQGTSGEWWYRKWNSGRAECGVDNKNFGNVDHSSKWGSMYRSNQMTFGSYPFSFSSRPFVSISFNSNSSGNHTSYVAYSSSNSTTVTPSFYLVDPNSGTANSSYFGIYVCGKWK